MQLRHALLLLTTFSLAAAPGHAQRPLREYDPAPRYTTFNLAVQLTGDPEHGREVALSWGRMRTLGPGRTWMPALELAAGVSPGTRKFVEGVSAGPRVTLARAFPGQYVGMGKKARGEPYLLAGAAMYGAGDFTGEARWGGAPAVSAGFGFRVFADAWEVDLSMAEVVLERRWGVQDGPLRLYLRLGRARAPRAPSASPLGGGR
jgi:hypothetical protein